MEESKNGSEIEQDVSWRSVGRTLYYPTMEIAALMDPSLQAWGQLIAEFQREPADSSVRQNYEALKWCFGHVRRGRAGEAA